MVSGNKSKSTRKGKAAVARPRSTPWGMIAAALVVVLFGGAVFGYAALQGREANEADAALAPFTPSAENPDPSVNIEGVQTVEFGGGVHVDPTVQVAYTYSPPIGGAHDYSWADCDGTVYDNAVRNENMVHGLEHGSIWIAYNPDQVTGEQLDVLRAKVENQNYMMMSPYPGLDAPISLQSWGHQLKLDDANDPRIDQFVRALRLNSNEFPEPGATCNASPQGTFDVTNPPPFVEPPAADDPAAYPESQAGDAVTPDAATTG